MSACTCDPVTGFVDEDCSKHGLPAGAAYAPMDRHARREYDRWGNPAQLEDARDVQRRLYLEAAPDHVRLRAAGFRLPLRPCPPRELGQR